MKNFLNICLSTLTCAALVVLIGCGQEETPVPEKIEGEVVLLLDLGEDDAMRLEGQILFDIFNYGAWLKNNPTSYVVVEGYSKDGADQGENEPKSAVCAKMIKKLFVTQGMADERMQETWFDIEDMPESDAKNAVKDGKYTCAVVARAIEE